MQKVRLEEVVDQIVAKDSRYHRDAYHFVREALDYTQKSVYKDPSADQPARPASGDQAAGNFEAATQARESLQKRHVTGQQLLQGIREYALEQFGPMTITVFEEWGVRRCEDFGEIVFSRADNGNSFLETEQDSRDDFKGGYTFEAAFKKPFLPALKAAISKVESSPGGA